MGIPLGEGSAFGADGGWNRATVEVVLPVYNEEAGLETSVRRLDRFLDSQFPFPATITIVDGNSTDRTWELALTLRDELTRVGVVQLGRSGKGLAVRTAWSRSSAEVVAYMDVDLSTDLSALPPLVAPLLSGQSDLALATRLSRNSTVVRGPKRELISRCYNLLLRVAFGVGFSDAQCGFKAMRTTVAQELLPLVEDDEWFFDSELLVLAERAGMRIFEVPVDWVDDPDSRVHLVSAAMVDLKGILRVGRAIAAGRLRLPDPPVRAAGRETTDGTHPAGGLFRFALDGLATVLLYLILFLALRTLGGPQLSNLLAFLISALVRRVTRGSPSAFSGGRWRLTGARGVVALGLGLALTAGSLAALQLLAPDAPQIWEAAVLMAAALAAMPATFALFRILLPSTLPGGRQQEAT